MSNYQNDTQKQVKLNDSTPGTVLSGSADLPYINSTLEFLLDLVGKVYAEKLRREEEIRTLNAQNNLNSMRDYKPIALIPDLRMFQLYNELKQEDNKISVLNLKEPDRFSASTEGETESSRESLVDSGSEPSQKGGKTVQSKFKNCYGLVVGRTIRSIKEYFRIKRQKKSQEIPENFRYYYIHRRIESLSDSETESFEKYIKKYHERSASEKKNRGKFMVQKYFEQDTANGLILVELVQEFLQSENADFQTYINNETKPKKQVSHVLSDEKNLTKLRETFKEMQFSLEKKSQNMKQETL